MLLRTGPRKRHLFAFCNKHTQTHFCWHCRTIRLRQSEAAFSIRKPAAFVLRVSKRSPASIITFNYFMAHKYRGDAKKPHSNEKDEQKRSIKSIEVWNGSMGIPFVHRRFWAACYERTFGPPPWISAMARNLFVWLAFLSQRIDGYIVGVTCLITTLLFSRAHFFTLYVV